MGFRHDHMKRLRDRRLLATVCAAMRAWNKQRPQEPAPCLNAPDDGRAVDCCADSSCTTIGPSATRRASGIAFAALALFLFGCHNTTDPTVPVCDEWATVYVPMPVQMGKSTVYTMFPETTCAHSHDEPNPHYHEGLAR